MNFLNDNHIRTLPWPALSPDLNPIEHLWGELGRRVRKRVNPPESIDQLQRALTDEWNNIYQAFVMRLIGSMRRRCLDDYFNRIKKIYILVKKRNVTPFSILITFLTQTIFYDKLLFSNLYVVMNIDMCTELISVQL
jgi:transposase